MKHNIGLVGFVFIASTLVLGACSQSDPTSVELETSGFPNLSGPLMGQTPPGPEAAIFAPRLVSTGFFTRDMAMSQDGRELFFTVAFSGGSTIMVSQEVGGVWQEPRVAPFSGHNRDFEPCLSANGSRMLFLSNRPPEGQPEKPGWGYQNIWVSERSDDGWGEALLMPEPITSDANEFFPSLTTNGTLYFTRGEDPEHAAIYRSHLEEGEYRELEKLPAEVNANDSQYNAFIAPDESFLLFATAEREDSLGGSDCYVAFRSPEDVWSPAVNLGPQVNDEGGCDSAMVTPDGKYLFFMSTRRDQALDKPLTGMTLSELQERGLQSGNGSADIYWIDAGIIEDLRPSN
ncbi:MAG: hypothetical protein GY906_20770 [bacterium]|nr:hypothetical protein [bacterium]